MNPNTDALVAGTQVLVEAIYGVAAPHPASAFVLSDPAIACALEGAGSRKVDEKLLLMEDADGLSLSLYLDQDLLERLSRASPYDSLDADNLDDFWSLVEGVSHFVYLTWNAVRARSVTPMELELQAEVDKYIATAMLFARQRGGSPRVLHRLLFDTASVEAGTDDALYARYHDANRYAARYCLGLERRYLRDRSVGLLDELRAFYRLDRGGKLARIGH